MNKYQAIHTERKDNILAEAKKLILERGISDRLMSEIALRAGISRQRLYLYYSNIDEILSDLIVFYLSTIFLMRHTRICFFYHSSAFTPQQIKRT